MSGSWARALLARIFQYGDRPSPEWIDFCVLESDPRPCKGTNTNICVAEGCFGRQCIELAMKSPT